MTYYDANSRRLPNSLPTILLVVSTVIFVLLYLASSAVAMNPGPPEFNKNTVEVSVIRTTRARFGDTIHPNGSNTTWKAYYGIQKGNETEVGHGECPGTEEVCGAVSSIEKLTAKTLYLVEIIATNSSGQASVPGEFETTGISAPEIEIRQPKERIRIHSAGFFDQVWSNDAETEYGVEYVQAGSRSEAEQLFDAKDGIVPPGVGCSGLIDSAEIAAGKDNVEPECEITGLAGETGYCMLYHAHNAQGTAFIVHNESPIQCFKTGSEKPETELAASETFINVTATSAHVAGQVYTGNAQTEWFLEYAESEVPFKNAETKCLANGANVGDSGSMTAVQSGEERVPTGGDLTGLEASKTYYVRLCAKNASGEAPSGVKSFTTSGLPVATTFAVHALDREAVRMLGSVNPGTSPSDGEQTVAIGGAPTGGKFTLTFEGQTTKEPEPAFDASAQEVGGTLAILPSIHGGANVRVTGTRGGPYTVEFVGALGGAAQPAMSGDGAGLIPSGSVTVVVKTAGGAGSSIHYHFEYTSDEQFQREGFVNASTTPEGDLGAGTTAVIRGANAPDMQSGVGYDYRIVASNDAGESAGGSQTISVPRAPATSPPPSCPNESLRTGVSTDLPDCRAYEQVTPTVKEGAEDTFSYSQNNQAHALVGEDGEHVLVSQLALQWGANPDPEAGNYFFTRGSKGWQMTSARPPGEASPLSYQPTLFSPDLTDVGIEASWSTTLTNHSELEFMAGATGGPYTTVARQPTGIDGAWVGASSDFSKLILQSADHSLVAPQTTTKSGDDLYEYSEGELRQVNVGVGTCGATIAKGIKGYSREAGGDAVSADGGRVFFEAVPGEVCSEPTHLYVREEPGEATVDIGQYEFVAANADGSQLLIEKRNGGVYEVLLYDTGAKTSQLLFSTPTKLANELALVSKDFTALYFYSRSSLTPEAPPVSAGNEDVGESPEDLYAYTIGTAGPLRFVAQVGAEANLGGGFSVSPDGRYFYFASEGVAGVPPGPIAGHGGSRQVYRYDDGEHLVQCMSCASSSDWEPALQSTFLPFNIHSKVNGVPLSSIASENGDYVFFDTTSALVQGDVDEQVPTGSPVDSGEDDFSFSTSSDVYEWRKPGIGGCLAPQGCLALISSGTGGKRNVLLGTTPSGRDVFFATHAQLVKQDEDTAGDVYDARVGGGFEPPPPAPVECGGATCQTPVAEPLDTTPASLTFVGPGNPQPVAKPAPKTKPKPKPKVCRKGMVRKRGKCVKVKRGKKAAKRAARPGRGRRRS